MSVDRAASERLAWQRLEQAMERLGETTREMWPLLDEADRLAAAADLPEIQAWVRAGAAEAALLLGDWDDAVRWGREALALGAGTGLADAVAQAWFVLRPIGASRADEALLRELGGWRSGRGPVPDAPRDRLMDAAVEVSVAAGTGGMVVGPEPDRVRHAWALADGEPSFVAARDAVLRAWWDAGRFDEVIEAVRLLPTDAEVAGPLAAGAAAIWRARLGRDEAAVVAEARSALVLAGRWGAAWWMEQAIAILDDAGAATPEERALRRRVRIRLLGDPGG